MKSIFNYVLIGLIFSITACTIKKDAFSYMATNTFLYGNQLGKVINRNYFLSYDGYLMEFIIKSDLPSLSSDSSKVKDKYYSDTLVVYVIDTTKKQYVELNSFSKDAKIINEDSLYNKTLGFQFKKKISSPLIFPSHLYYDTIIEHKKYVTTNNIVINPNGSSVKYVLDKYRSFISVYNLTVNQYFNSNYITTEFFLNSPEGKIQAFGKIEQLNKLDRKEKEIVNSIIRKVNNRLNVNK